MEAGVAGLRRRGGLETRKPMPPSLSLSPLSFSTFPLNQKKKIPRTSQSSQYAASGTAMAAALAMAAAAAAAGPRASDWFVDDGSLLSLLAAPPPGLAEYGSFDLALC